MKKLPVVDGAKVDGGDIYGYATTARGALIIANREFVDPISHIETIEYIPGQSAFLALTIYGAGKA